MGITVATVRVAADTGGGNQDITTTDLGGLTPLAVFFTITRATSDGVAADHAVLGYGAATGAANRWAICVASEHNQAATDTWRRGVTDECVLIIDPTNGFIDGEADFNAWIANGITITWGNNPAAGYYITADFYAGTDLSAHAWNFALGNQDVETDINTVGFEPDALRVVCQGNANNDVSNSESQLAHGVVLNTTPVYQACWAVRGRDGQASGSPLARITETYGTGQLGAGGAWWWAGDFGSFDSTGFSCWPRLANAGGDEVGFLALAFNGAAEFAAGIIDSPTSTGNHSETDPRFRPQHVVIGLTQMPAIDTSYIDANAGSIGSTSFDEDDAICTSMQEEDAAANTDTQSLCNDQIIDFPDDDGTAAWAATLVGFIANGWELNFTASEGTAVKWWYLAIEAISEVSVLSDARNAYIEEVEFIAPDGLILKPTGFEDIDVLREQAGRRPAKKTTPPAPESPAPTPPEPYVPPPLTGPFWPRRGT